MATLQEVCQAVRCAAIAAEANLQAFASKGFGQTSSVRRRTRRSTGTSGRVRQLLPMLSAKRGGKRIAAGQSRNSASGRTDLYQSFQARMADWISPAEGWSGRPTPPNF